MTPDDIDAFAVHNRDALAAADEYVRRAEKGLPSDRWCDGHAGAVLVARGIKAYRRMSELFSDAWLERDRMDAERSANSMEAHADPARGTEGGTARAVNTRPAGTGLSHERTRHEEGADRRSDM